MHITSDMHEINKQHIFRTLKAPLCSFLITSGCPGNHLVWLLSPLISFVCFWVSYKWESESMHDFWSDFFLLDIVSRYASLLCIAAICNISLFGNTTIIISLLMDIWESFGSMTMLPWTFLVLYMSFGGHMHSYVLGIDLLGYMFSFG